MDLGAVIQHIWETLHDCPGAVPYIDDILVYGRSQQEHDQNLGHVSQVLHTDNFWLQLSKCQFC